MSLFNTLLSRIIRAGQLTVTDADGLVTVYGMPHPDVPSIAIRLADRRVALDIGRRPELGAGEAYMDHRLIVENDDIMGLLALLRVNSPWEKGGGFKDAGLLDRMFHSVTARLDRLNWSRRAKQNVAHHYDLDDRLYDLFLDENRQYSCGYFTDPANDLDQAQRDKLAHIAAKLALKPGMRVLDIGCGWGGTALYLNRVADVDVLGVTLSEEQLKVARQRAEEAGVADRVKFELIDYRALTGTFDRIVSIGMFEHVGAAHYDEFYATCHDLLTPDGVMLLHTIGRFGEAGAPDPFTDKWIFPGYHLPSLSQMSTASQKVRLIASDIETLRLHYAYTLRHWLTRTRAHKAEIIKLHDERLFRLWEFYLAGGILMFESGASGNYQVQYIRDRHALPITRDYMAEAEARYRAM